MLGISRTTLHRMLGRQGRGLDENNDPLIMEAEMQ
jgi:hypothetical protein